MPWRRRADGWWAAARPRERRKRERWTRGEVRVGSSQEGSHGDCRDASKMEERGKAECGDPVVALAPPPFLGPEVLAQEDLAGLRIGTVHNRRGRRGAGEEGTLPSGSLSPGGAANPAAAGEKASHDEAASKPAIASLIAGSEDSGVKKRTFPYHESQWLNRTRKI